MRAYSLSDVTLEAWKPLPGDLVTDLPKGMMGQWPPDGCRTLLSGSFRFHREIEWHKFDQGGPAIVVCVCPRSTLTELLIYHEGRLWWYPHRTVKDADLVW